MFTNGIIPVYFLYLPSMKWIEIPSHYLQDKDNIQLVSLPEKTFCLAYAQGSWVAFAKKCPHAGAGFTGGWCEGNEVVCPFHRRRFDLTTGKGAAGQGDYIDIYPLQQDGDRVSIGVAPGFWKKLLG